MFYQWRSDFQISSDGSRIGKYINIKPETTVSNISMPPGSGEGDTNDNKNQVQDKSNKIYSQ